MLGLPLHLQPGEQVARKRGPVSQRGGDPIEHDASNSHQAFQSLLGIPDERRIQRMFSG
jgi:hypothetical protein